MGYKSKYSGRQLEEKLDSIKNINVVDALDSEDGGAALSANQGRVLKKMIDELPSGGTVDGLEYLEFDTPATADEVMNIISTIQQRYDTTGKMPIAWINGNGEHSLISQTIYQNEQNGVLVTRLMDSEVMYFVTSGALLVVQSSLKMKLDASASDNNKMVAALLQLVSFTDWQMFNIPIYLEIDGVMYEAVSKSKEINGTVYGSFVVGNTLKIYKLTHSENGVFVPLLKSEIPLGGEGDSTEVIDNLESDSTTAALSANQGKVLKEMIENIPSGGLELRELKMSGSAEDNAYNLETLELMRENKVLPAINAGDGTLVPLTYGGDGQFILQVVQMGIEMQMSLTMAEDGSITMSQDVIAPYVLNSPSRVLEWLDKNRMLAQMGMHETAMVLYNGQFCLIDYNKATTGDSTKKVVQFNYGSQRFERVYNATTGEEISTTEIPLGGGGGGITEEKMVKVTYAELKALRDEGKLIAGQMYRMTDYETTCTWENTQVAGHPFDLVLTALDERTLDEKCSAIWSDRDTDGYFANSNLPAWDVRYCLDNDKGRFDWAKGGKLLTFDMSPYFSWLTEVKATLTGKYEYNGTEYHKWEAIAEGELVYILTETDSPKGGDLALMYVVGEDETIEVDILSAFTEENGKGVIYRLIDEYENSVPYDFKNIMFLRTLRNSYFDENGISLYCYTCNLQTHDNAISDISIKEGLCFNFYMDRASRNNVIFANEIRNFTILNSKSNSMSVSVCHSVTVDNAQNIVVNTGVFSDNKLVRVENSVFELRNTQFSNIHAYGVWDATLDTIMQTSDIGFLVRGSTGQYVVVSISKLANIS